MRIIIIAAALVLSGCATSLSGIRNKAVQEVVTSPRSIEDIERCIVLSQPGGRTPYAVTVAGVRELTINQEAAGAVMLFQMRQVPEGTEVTFRRKGVFVSNDDAAKRCYH